MHTKDILAKALRDAGLNAMADKAAEGYYHDFLSPLATPCQQLAHDLKTFADAPSLSGPRRLVVQTLLAKHYNGEFDASKEESAEWANSQEGQETIGKLAAIDPRTPLKPDRREQIGRLAMREEGDFWNAYYAMPDTMDGALLLGSIRRQFVEDKTRKAAFMDMMRETVSDILEAATGHRPIWPDGVKSAPEHERGQPPVH